MLQTQYTQSNQKAKKNHSRKQLVQWIAKEANDQQKTIALSFNQNLLKNGVFFLSILQKVFPQESTSIKSKMKQKPVSQYDFDKNVTLAKKILDKYNLQYNLDVNDIIKNKGCFDFLNWMKNLNDGLITRSSEQNINSKHVSAQKNASPMKKSQMAHSGYKTNRQGSGAKSGQKTHSQAKSSRNYSAQKTQNPNYKTKTGKNLVQITNKQLPVLQNNRSHVVQEQQRKYSNLKKSIYMSEWDSLDDCNEAMHELALQENIQTFRKMLAKVKEKVNNTKEDQTLQQFLEKIHQTMFGRN